MNVVAQNRAGVATADIEGLRAENEMLRERVAQLETMLAPLELPPRRLKLTVGEASVMATLMAHGPRSKEQIHAALYGLAADGGAEIKIIDVFICKLRRKLKPHGVEIETLWGIGYVMSPAAVERLKAMRDAEIKAGVA